MRGFNIEMILAALAPWQGQNPIDVGAQHWNLSRLRGSAFQAVDLFARLGRHLGRHDLLIELFAQLVDLVGTIYAQFFLNGAQLFAQIKFLLRAIYLRAHAAADGRFEFENFDLVAHNHADFFQARQRVKRLQQVLLLLWIGHKVRRKHIREARSGFKSHNGGNIFDGETAIELGVPFKQIGGMTHQGVGLWPLWLRLHKLTDGNAHKWFLLDILIDMHAAQAVEKYLKAAILLAVHSSDFYQRAESIDVFRFRVFNFRIKL